MSKLQNVFTTPEQSKRLLELGVPADSANLFYDCSVFARVKYVHELQHALKLCRIDKEIVV